MSDVARRGSVVRANVNGSEPEPYVVTLAWDGSRPADARCTCPYDKGGWCEHIVATLLSLMHHPASIEERISVPDLLRPLDTDTLRMLVIRLVESDPSLAHQLEAQVGLLTSEVSSMAATSRDSAPPEPVDVEALRRELRSLFQGLGRGGSWSVGTISGEVDRMLERAWGRIHSGAGRSALPALEVITDEVWSSYEHLDDSDGEEVVLFEGIGNAWAEALLSPDVTIQDRQRWSVRLENWHAELANYGLDEGFDAAVQAVEQGWEDPTLTGILQGQGGELQGGIRESALVTARLNILERGGRWDEYLRFADAADRVVASATMLMKLGRINEAVTLGLEHLSTTQDALTLAQALHQRQELWRALEIARHGMALDVPKAMLAAWAGELAATLGDTTLALAASEIAFREGPTLDRYQRVRELSGDDWPLHRDVLLNHVRASLGGYGYPREPAEIFLYEGLIDDAIAAVNAGVSSSKLDKVVDAAIASRPEWVIATCRREAESIMDREKAEYYTSAAYWEGRARGAYREAGREADWHTYKGQLLAKHGRKHRLVPLLKPL